VLRLSKDAIKTMNWKRRAHQQERRDLADAIVDLVLAGQEKDTAALSEFLALTHKHREEQVLVLLRKSGFCRPTGDNASGPPLKFKKYVSQDAKNERKQKRLGQKKANVQTASLAPAAASQPVARAAASVQKSPLTEVMAEAPADAAPPRIDNSGDDSDNSGDDSDDAFDTNYVERIGNNDEEDDDGCADDQDNNEPEDARLNDTGEELRDTADKKERVVKLTSVFPGAQASFNAPHIVLTRLGMVDIVNRSLNRLREVSPSPTLFRVPQMLTFPFLDQHERLRSSPGVCRSTQHHHLPALAVWSSQGQCWKVRTCTPCSINNTGSSDHASAPQCPYSPRRKAVHAVNRQRQHQFCLQVPSPTKGQGKDGSDQGQKGGV
jgi:hypothetical protein